MVLWFCNQVEGGGSANTLNNLIPEFNTEAMAFERVETSLR